MFGASAAREKKMIVDQFQNSGSLPKTRNIKEDSIPEIHQESGNNSYAPKPGASITLKAAPTGVVNKAVSTVSKPKGASRPNHTRSGRTKTAITTT